MSTDPGVGDPVLRVAFWTDDESAKINVNTASATNSDSYADIPRANFKDERAIIAMKQPDENEFNRYPGHPATVNLLTVFPDSTIEQLIKTTPRYEWGGSENADKAINESRTPLTNSKKDRLYASVDELHYTPDRTDQFDISLLDSRRFFLTASSRSSDLNLFGQPRVTIWPLWANNDADDPRTANLTRRTPYDQLIANASTIGPVGSANAKRYAFVRNDSLSQTVDWQAFPRNKAVFAYLRDMTGRAIPGFGGSFLSKYAFPGERDQILTEIFDYIRCTNLNETYRGQGSGFLSYTKKLDNPTGSSGNHVANKDYAGSGYVLPIKIAEYNTRGAGRVPVLSQVGIWLIQTYTDPVEDGDGNPIEPAPPNPPRVQVGLVLETFSPMQGPMTWMPLNFRVKLRNISAPQIEGRDIFPDGNTESFSSGAAGSRLFRRSRVWRTGWLGVALCIS